MTKKPNGIGGWLILPTIGLFLSAILNVFGIIAGLYLWGSGTWIYTGLSEYYFIFIAVSAAILEVLVIYALVLEFKKKKLFPKVAIATMWTGVLFSFILAGMDGDPSGLIREIIPSAVWTLYFIVSERVKNTFVK